MMLRCAREVSAAALSHRSWSYAAICSRRNRSWYAAGHADALEGAVGDDDAVPVAAGDLGGEELAALAGEILLAGDQQPGVGIELHELAPELLQHVIGHDIQRLVDQPGLLHLHAGGGHVVGLARADRMGQERIAAAHDAPDGVFLMRVEGDVRVHARKGQVRAVEAAQAEVVVGVVVERVRGARCARDRRRSRRGSAP